MSQYLLEYAIAHDYLPCAYCGFFIDPGDEYWIVDTNPANHFAKTIPSRIHTHCLESYLREEAEHESKL